MFKHQVIPVEQIWREMSEEQKLNYINSMRKMLQLHTDFVAWVTDSLEMSLKLGQTTVKIEDISYELYDLKTDLNEILEEH